MPAAGPGHRHVLPGDLRRHVHDSPSRALDGRAESDPRVARRALGGRDGVRAWSLLRRGGLLDANDHRGHGDRPASTPTSSSSRSSGTAVASRCADFNFWGVTFAADSDTFYATLSSGGVNYLIVGRVTTRRVQVVRADVECPSLSPDGTHIAYKHRVSRRRVAVVAVRPADRRRTRALARNAQPGRPGRLARRWPCDLPDGRRRWRERLVDRDQRHRVATAPRRARLFAVRHPLTSRLSR